jgi:hypothetical protein
MQKHEQGYALILSLIGLAFISLSIKALVEDLADLAQMIYLWAQQQQQTKMIKNFALEELNSGKFDYHWQFLGEYPCIQLCQPTCLGTQHWRLSVSHGQAKLHLMVIKPAKHLTCSLPHPITFDHAVIWKRKI